MVNTRKFADIVAVKDDLSCKFVHIFLDFIVFDHDHDKIDCIKEFVQIVELVYNDIFRDEEKFPERKARSLLRRRDPSA